MKEFNEFQTPLTESLIESLPGSRHISEKGGRKNIPASLNTKDRHAKRDGPGMINEIETLPVHLI